MTENKKTKRKWKTIVETPKLGEILMGQDKITVDQLGEALERQKSEKLPLGEVLIKMGVINTEDLLKALDLQVNIGKLIKESLEELKGSDASNKEENR